MRRRLVWFVVLAVVLRCHRPLPLPANVELVAPADGAVVRRAMLLLQWQTTEPQSQVQVSTSSRFTTMLFDTLASGESVQVTLPTDGSYFWRVRAVSADSVRGEWSEARSLRLERFRILATGRTQGYPHDVVVVGNRAYVADGEAGLAVFDVSNPELPVLLGTKLDSLNVAWGVAARDSLAYIAYGYKELMIVNAARPESMVTLGVLEYPQPGTGYDVALADSFAFVAAGAQFLKVGISDPRYPNLVYQGYYPRDCYGVSIAGPVACVALGQLGMACWRIDTIPPTQVGWLDTQGKARAIAAADGLAFVADGLNGLVVVDISNPAQPSFVAELALKGYANGVAVQDTLVYVTCGAGGIAVVNAADRARPQLVTQLPGGYAMGVCPVGRYVFAGDRDLGLVVIKQEE